MSLLVYGIVEAGTSAEGLGDGLDGRALGFVAEGPLLAVVSDHGDAPALAPTAAALRTYDGAIRRLMERDAILPARFGSVLKDEPAVRELLRRRHEDLLPRLRRTRGAVEIALRATWRSAAFQRPQIAPQSGTAYLREGLQLRRRARGVAAELDSVSAFARSARRTLIPRRDVAVLDAYLVGRQRVDELVAMVERLDRRLDDVELVCTGPWPPYSFAQGAPV
ncbi:MAG: GvpL/GvpF family gas vesicle protein [Solirubrobacteraceae bacterium]